MEREGMNRTECRLLLMAVLFTVLSSLFTHLCWELRSTLYHVEASISGVFAVLTGALCLACLDMLRMAPAASHTLTTLLLQYLKVRSSRVSYNSHIIRWRKLAEDNNDKLQQNQKTTSGFHQHTDSSHKTNPTPKQTDKYYYGHHSSEENHSEEFQYHERLYWTRIGKNRKIPTLRRIARLEKNCVYNIAFGDISDCDTSFGLYAYEGAKQLSQKDLIRRKSREDVYVSRNQMDKWRSEAILLLLEADLGVLQSPDIPTLINFITFIETKLGSLCKEIRKYCYSMDIDKLRLSDKINHNTWKVTKKGNVVVNGNRNLPVPGTLSIDYLHKREMNLRTIVDHQESQSHGVIPHLWPSLGLISILKWDRKYNMDLVRLRAANRRLPEVVFSAWLPLGVDGLIWGEPCGQCVDMLEPTFQLRTMKGLVIQFQEDWKGDVCTVDQLENRRQYGLIVCTLSGDDQIRISHTVEVDTIHGEKCVCFKIISD